MIAVIELLLNAALWFPAALVLATAATAVQRARAAKRGTPRRIATLAALHTCYGCVIGVMGTGHLVAVTIRAVQGTLAQGVTWPLYPLGFALAIPAALMVASAARLPAAEATQRRRLTVLDAWLALVLIALLTSAPLAIPALLNLVYLRSARPAVDRAVLMTTALTYLAMFVASLVLGGGDF
jgi:hypothetical protein